MGIEDVIDVITLLFVQSVSRINDETVLEILEYLERCNSMGSSQEEKVI